MASIVLYNSFKKDLLDGNIDLSADTIKVMLTTSSYTPNIDSHTKRSDVTNEVSGTGYTSGGATLANKSLTQDNTNDKAVFDADDVSWASSTITARYGVIYKSRGGASSADELIGYIDFGSNITSSSTTLTIAWNSSGILSLN